jgi:hypothetical protein
MVRVHAFRCLAALTMKLVPLQSFTQLYPFISRTPHDLRAEEDLDVIYPNQISPHLFLGGHICTINLSVLKSMGIRSVLNLTPDTPNLFPESLQYLRVHIIDSDTADLTAIIQQCVDFIGTRVVQQAHSVLTLL